MVIKAKNLDKVLDAIIEFCDEEDLMDIADTLIDGFIDTLEISVGEEILVDEEEDSLPLIGLAQEFIRSGKAMGFTDEELLEGLAEGAREIATAMGDEDFIDFARNHMVEALRLYHEDND